MSAALGLVVFAGVLGIILGGYWLFVLRGEDVQGRALRRRLRGRRAVIASPVVKASDQRSAIGSLDGILGRSRIVLDPVNELLQKSGSSITPGTVVLACVFAAIVTFAVVHEISPWLLVAVVAAMVAGWIPIVVLKYKVTTRLALFEDQFPEAMDLMARALRAGHALTTALQMVGEEVPDPVGGEFRQLYEQQNYGLSLPDALRAFAVRVPILDARFFVTALLTQRETGGNLSEVLDNLASVIRERFKVKRQVRVMSAHGRITGWALGLLPPVVALVLIVLSPQQMRPLIDDPLGVYMITGAIVLQVVGVLIIRKIVNVEY